jgi:hypothetical protein
MNIRKCKMVLSVMIAQILILSSLAQAEIWSWEYFRAPSINNISPIETTFEDFDGATFVGRYRFAGDANYNQGFRLDRSSNPSTWTTIHDTDVDGVIVYGIHGNIVAGEYQVVESLGNGINQSVYNGFFSTDSGATLNPLVLSGAASGSSAIPTGVVGSKIIGTYYSNPVTALQVAERGWYNRTNTGGLGFVHDTANAQTQYFSIANAESTEAWGMLGNSVVFGQANFNDPTGLYAAGFLYDLTTQSETILRSPFEDYANTSFYGSDDESRIVGVIGGSAESNGVRGILYYVATQNWELLDAPGATDTWAMSIHGDQIVGSAFFADPNGSGQYRVEGFIATAIPEPTSTLLLFLGGIFCLSLGRKRWLA